MNQRNNARVLLMVAKELGLCIPTKHDQNAYELEREIAVCTTETMIHSIANGEAGTIMVHNQCCDTRSCNNGILCAQHASDGIRIFKGPVATNQMGCPYGRNFGHSSTTGPSSFPVCTAEMQDSYLNSCKHVTSSVPRSMTTITTKQSPVVSRINYKGEVTHTPESVKYACIDEAYIKMLTTLQWNRDDGIIELIPIAVVVYDRK